MAVFVIYGANNCKNKHLPPSIEDVHGCEFVHQLIGFLGKAPQQNASFEKWFDGLFAGKIHNCDRHRS